MGTFHLWQPSLWSIWWFVFCTRLLALNNVYFLDLNIATNSLRRLVSMLKMKTTSATTTHPITLARKTGCSQVFLSYNKSTRALGTVSRPICISSHWLHNRCSHQLISVYNWHAPGTSICSSYFPRFFEGLWYSPPQFLHRQITTVSDTSLNP